MNKRNFLDNNSCQERMQKQSALLIEIKSNSGNKQALISSQTNDEKIISFFLSVCFIREAYFSRLMNTVLFRLNFISSIFSRRITCTHVST